MGGEQGQLRDRPRLAWWVVGIIFGAVMLFVFYVFIGTFALGLFMYYATRPIYDRLESRLGHPGVTAIASLLAIAVPILVLVAYAIAVSAIEVAEIAGESVGDYQGVLQPYLDLSSLTVHPQQILDLARESQGAFVRLGGPELLGGVVSAASGFGLTLLQLFVALALAFYLLRDDDKLVRWFVSDIGGRRSTVYSYGSAVDDNLQTVYFGSILQAFVVALAAAVVYNVAAFVAPVGLSIPLPTLLGLLTGVASLIPHVGTKLVYVPIALSLLIRALGEGVTALWFPVVFVVVVVLALDVVTETVIRPYTAGRNLHVGLMSFAYIFGPLLFGWYGLFVGPLLLVLLVQFNRIVLPELMQGEPLPAQQVTGDIESEPEETGEKTREEEGAEMSEESETGSSEQTAADEEIRD
ncbi:AI-2E family transporter [Haladaptatus sp. DFWS20]|uniref:AI-2E family transporter n=1 Tax=Haladaptatus sp. DFWS20 TaxID=3403467 RepID=UPI003EBFA456